MNGFEIQNSGYGEETNRGPLKRKNVPNAHVSCKANFLNADKSYYFLISFCVLDDGLLALRRTVGWPWTLDQKKKRNDHGAICFGNEKRKLYCSTKIHSLCWGLEFIAQKWITFGVYSLILNSQWSLWVVVIPRFCSMLSKFTFSYIGWRKWLSKESNRSKLVPPILTPSEDCGLLN